MKNSSLNVPYLLSVPLLKPNCNNCTKLEIKEMLTSIIN